ncbi:isochorismatase [Vibrio coralliilyticus]|uniref:YybH family protein n=1 Tax=Vibrio coralliilyticus TaxID=190893 RepID=UPI00148CB230|nr:nuclear transport factor 2 family protein [Vibrio coralliilyticus]NOH52645.1 isochorismatase [Vibrio coralliilyticus]
MSQSVLEACQAGIEAWKAAFNRQDAKGCAEQYAEGTTMIAKPFGMFEGREQIQAFWQNIIDQGFSDVSYTDTTWEKVDDNNYILSSKWTMNKAFGVVHKEVWTLQEDGKARLTYDEFEVLGER